MDIDNRIFNIENVITNPLSNIDYLIGKEVLGCIIPSLEELNDRTFPSFLIKNFTFGILERIESERKDPFVLKTKSGLSIYFQIICKVSFPYRKGDEAISIIERNSSLFSEDINWEDLKNALIYRSRSFLERSIRKN